MSIVVRWYYGRHFTICLTYRRMLQERVDQRVVVEVIITEVKLIIAAGRTDLLRFTTLEKCYAHFRALQSESEVKKRKQNA